MDCHVQPFLFTRPKPPLPVETFYTPSDALPLLHDLFSTGPIRWILLRRRFYQWQQEAYI